MADKTTVPERMEHSQLAQLAEAYTRIMESIPQAGTLEKKALSVKESCQYIGGITTPTLYALMGSGDISSYTIGRRRFILKADLDAYLRKRIEAE
jgi:excisionase family DNA binding protein